MNLDSLPSQSVLDVAGTLARFGGDQQLFRDILEFYLEDAPPLMAELCRAADVPHAAAVRSTAHALKGLVAGCGGIRAAQAAQRIEKAAAEGDLKDLAPLLEKLEIELDLLTQAAREHRG
jgi:HPt (histidine-containing phosphotransfer) domain-containing protein